MRLLELVFLVGLCAVRLSRAGSFVLGERWGRGKGQGEPGSFKPQFGAQNGAEAESVAIEGCQGGWAGCGAGDMVETVD